MRILILGGTAFLSAATARQAIERGHQVTCLARGTTSEPPAGASWIRSDRDSGPQIAGIFNATGDSVPLPEVLALAAEVADHHGEAVAVEPSFLVDHGIQYWAGPDSLPLWVPASYTGFGNRSIAAATERGLQLRPVAETLARVLAEARSLGLERDRQAGLTPATEQRVLDAWRSSRGASNS